jgi:hypothetical protein
MIKYPTQSSFSSSSSSPRSSSSSHQPAPSNSPNTSKSPSLSTKPKRTSSSKTKIYNGTNKEDIHTIITADNHKRKDMPTLDAILAALPLSVVEMVNHLIYERITIIVEALHPSGYTQMVVPDNNTPLPTATDITSPTRTDKHHHRPSSSSSSLRLTGKVPLVVVPSTTSIALSTLRASLTRNSRALRKIVGPTITGYLIQIINQWDQLPFFRIDHLQQQQQPHIDGTLEDQHQPENDHFITSYAEAHKQQHHHHRYGRDLSLPAPHDNNYYYSPYPPHSGNTYDDGHLLSQLLATILPDNNSSNYIPLLHIADYYPTDDDSSSSSARRYTHNNPTVSNNQVENYPYLLQNTTSKQSDHPHHHQQQQQQYNNEPIIHYEYDYFVRPSVNNVDDEEELQYHTELLRILDQQSSYSSASPSTTVRDKDFDLLQQRIHTVITSPPPPPPPPPFSPPPYLTQPRIHSSSSPSSQPSPLAQVFLSPRDSSYFSSLSIPPSGSTVSLGQLQYPLQDTTNDAMYDAVLLTQLHQVGSLMGLVKNIKNTLSS